MTRSEDKFKGEFRKVLFGEEQMTLAIIVLATASEAKGLNSLKHSLFPNKSEVGRTAQPIVRSEKI